MKNEELVKIDKNKKKIRENILDKKVQDLIIDLKEKHIEINIFSNRNEVNKSSSASNFLEKNIIESKSYKLKSSEDNYIIKLKEILQDHTNLNSIKWKNLKVIAYNQKFTLLPKEFVNNDQLIHKFLNLSCYLKKDDFIYYNILDKSDIIVAFGISKNIIECINDIYFPEKINVVHQEFNLLEKILNQLSSENKNVSNLFINIEEENLHITNIKKSKIIYHNKFQYETIEKAIHYILIIIETIMDKLNESTSSINNNEKLTVILYGEVYANHPIAKNLSQYVENILIQI